MLITDDLELPIVREIVSGPAVDAFDARTEGRPKTSDPPTREEWKEMVARLGYRAAVDALGCDLDDVPGIEETWLENFRRMAPRIAESEAEFFAEYRRRKEDGSLLEGRDVS